jgi:DNA polymerase-3 subunit delta
MFGGERIIRISGSTRRNLGDALRPVLENPPIDCRLIIEAGDLKRESAIRKLVERSRTGMAIPCYLDGEKELDRLITTVLRSAGLTIDPDAREILRASLGSDRRLSRNELEKLALYCDGTGRVGVQDVNAIVGDSSASDSDDAIDAVATGDVEKLAILMPRLLTVVPGDMLVLWTLRYFQSIQLARFKLEKDRISAEAVVGNMRPPPNYLRRPALIASLRLWSLPLIERALSRLDGAAHDIRRNAALGRPLAESTLLAIASEAARARSRSTRNL